MPKTSTRPRLAVPYTVTISMGEVAEDMREGLLALAVGAGLQVGKQFRRVNGHLHLSALQAALQRHVAEQTVGADHDES